MNPQSRVAAVIAVMAAALLAAACGTAGGAPGAGGPASPPSGVGYSRCMRSHGVPGYPDPDGNGQLPKITSGQQVGVSDARLTAAQGACQDLWPYQAPGQAQQRQQLADALKFARCMRSHQVPDWPDPSTDPDSGRVEFVLGTGIDVHSPRILGQARACEHGLPASLLPGSPGGVEVTTAP